MASGPLKTYIIGEVTASINLRVANGGVDPNFSDSELGTFVDNLMENINASASGNYSLDTYIANALDNE